SSRPGKMVVNALFHGAGGGAGFMPSCPGQWSWQSTLEDLKVQEVEVNCSVVKAVGCHYDTQCGKPNKEFMFCFCGERSKIVLRGRHIKLHCVEPFTNSWNGFDYSAPTLFQLQTASLSTVCWIAGHVKPDLGDQVTKVKTDKPLPENPNYLRPRPEPSLENRRRSE
ncbi:LOW QUALITY PROTEIN: NADH dehydrogenase [ubiquinone] 1 alpha subcomplex subunit 8, partial [Galemys pyrenaicus]